jgi:rod shape-determining protein MreC
VLAFLKRYRELLLVLILLLLPAGTYIANAKGGRDLSSLDHLCLAVSAPMARAVDVVVGGAIDAWSEYVALRGVREENQRLRGELARARAEITTRREGDLENERLRKLLAFSQASTGSLVAAPVIGVSPTHRRMITIAKGKGEGVAEGMAVVTAEGVLGRVISTTGSYAQVQLLVDSTSAIAARVQRSRARATVRGTGDEAVMQLDNALRTDDIQDGDLLVTSGTDRVFPKGLVIGRVQKAERRAYGMYLTAEVRPAVDLKAVEEVLVVVVPGDEDAPSSAELNAQPAAVVPGAP